MVEWLALIYLHLQFEHKIILNKSNSNTLLKATLGSFPIIHDNGMKRNNLHMSNKRKQKICLYIQNILTPQKGLGHKHGCKKHLTLDSSNGTSSASHDGVARLGASTSLGGALIIAFIPSLLSSQQTDHVPLPPSQTEHPHVYSCLRRGVRWERHCHLLPYSMEGRARTAERWGLTHSRDPAVQPFLVPSWGHSMESCTLSVWPGCSNFLAGKPQTEDS